MNLDLAKSMDRRVGSLLGRLIGWGDRVGEMVRPPEPVREVHRILISKFWGLGNWALLRPIVQDVRARWPAAHLKVATLAHNEALVSDLADELILVRADATRHTLRDLMRGVRGLRRARPDLTLDFEQFARTGALLARLGGGRQRIGFHSADPGRDGLYTVVVPFRPDVHAARSFRDLAEAAGVAPADTRLGGLAPSASGRAELERLSLRRPFVVLHPGSGDNFPGRRWSVAGFAAVARAARAEGRHVYVSGGAAEKELAARVVAAAGDGVESLAGRLGVHALVALLAEADVLVANDTGPVHVASQLRTPVLAVFGPNTPVVYGPRSDGSRAFYRDLPCSPCITVANYRSSRCRIHTCMASVPTGEVVTALRGLLRAAPVPSPESSHEA